MRSKEAKTLRYSRRQRNISLLKRCFCTSTSPDMKRASSSWSSWSPCQLRHGRYCLQSECPIVANMTPSWLQNVKVTLIMFWELRSCHPSVFIIVTLRQKNIRLCWCVVIVIVIVSLRKDRDLFCLASPFGEYPMRKLRENSFEFLNSAEVVRRTLLRVPT